MFDLIEDIEKEHIRMRDMLRKVLSMSKDKNIDIAKVKEKLEKLHIFWNVHELEEDHIFNNMNYKGFPETKSILEQHMQLRGHWKAINLALSTNDSEEIRIAIETDGEMLAKKFIEHMKLEERYFKKIKNMK